MRKVGIAGICAGIFLLCAPARAASPDQTAVQNVLTAFMEAFNSGESKSVCDIFAPDLLYDYHGLTPNRTSKDLCDGLHVTLADPARRFQYALHTEEIFVSGDIAVARVVWTLTLISTAAPKPVTTKEYSMDLFRRQGPSWKLFRFNAFDTE
jgi:ketosteroid isomerase-like protein